MRLDYDLGQFVYLDLTSGVTVNYSIDMFINFF